MIEQRAKRAISRDHPPRVAAPTASRRRGRSLVRDRHSADQRSLSCTWCVLCSTDRLVETSGLMPRWSSDQSSSTCRAWPGRPRAADAVGHWFGIGLSKRRGRCLGGRAASEASDQSRPPAERREAAAAHRRLPLDGHGCSLCVYREVWLLSALVALVFPGRCLSLTVTWLDRRGCGSGLRTLLSTSGACWSCRGCRTSRELPGLRVVEGS